MLTIKQLLNSLTPENQELLRYAFENGLAQYVVVSQNIFVGVHLDDNSPGFTIEQRSGAWCSGRKELGTVQ